MNKFKLTLGFLALGIANAADTSKTSEATKLPNIAKQARTIIVHAKDVIEIDCRVNVPTMIALPEGEEAMVVQGGDASPDGTWLYQTASGGPARRYVAVKPSVIGSSAALHIISSHNIPYTFMVREVSNVPAIAADVSVFISAGEDLEGKVNQAPSIVSAEEANQYKLFRFSWKWRERSAVKITERTREERTEALHAGRKGYHPAKASDRAGTGLGVVRQTGTPAHSLLPLAEGVLRERAGGFPAEGAYRPLRRAGANRLFGEEDPDEG